MSGIIFDFQNIALLITSLINFVLASVLYFYGKGKKVNRMYAINILFLIGWAAAMILYRSADAEDSLLFATLLYISPTFIASTFLHFTYVFPLEEKLTKTKTFFIYSGTLAIIVLTAIPNTILLSVDTISGQEKVIHFGSSYILYGLYIIFYFSFGFFRLYKKWLYSVGIQRVRIFYLLSGYSLAANFAFVTNLILPWFGYFQFNWAGQVFNIFIVTFTALAIIKHQLMDVKLVLRKYSVYLSSLGTVVLFAYLLQYGWRYFFMNGGVISNLVIVALSVSLFPLIRRHYYHFANKYLFSSLYDSREVISTLSDKLRATLDLKTIYQSIFETLESAFHQKSFAIALFDAESKTYYSVYTNNISLSLDTIPSQAVCKFVVKYDKPFSLDDERIRIPAGFQVLQKAGIEVVNPLNLKGKCIALILLGQKESGDRYNEEDFSVLNITGTQAATAIDNARLYEEVKHFNEDLQKKVADATKKLQTQNEKLKELDKLKTEFISVASHQLRTPLTATKWALEFLLKGEDGKINAKQRESLNEMSLMNVRLITLVNELLNISRIDEGRLKIEPQPINIAVAVKDSLAELLPIARKKELNVIEHYDEVPSINLDPNVMTKAISNILSNAIKYNRDGKHLWVNVRKHKDSVSIIIKDEGIGIPKAEQGSLFQRFYRASNAASSNTEGTGLGLYIAKSVLEMSGGTITFESEEGVGTTFTIILPLKGSKARKGEKSLA